jgi:hypothetical protein
MRREKPLKFEAPMNMPPGMLGVDVAKTRRGVGTIVVRWQHDGPLILAADFGRSFWRRCFGQSNIEVAVAAVATGSRGRPRDGRAFPSASTGSGGQVCVGENGCRFRERAREFQQKIIWVLRSSRVQFV